MRFIAVVRRRRWRTGDVGAEIENTQEDRSRTGGTLSHERPAGPLAHRVEQGTFNPKVPGSSPGRPTERPRRSHSQSPLSGRARPPTVTDVPRPSPSDGSDGAPDGDRLALWWAPVDVPASTRQSLAGCLSSAEQRRGETYNRPLDRDRFLAARGWLRRLLAGLLLCDARDIEMVTTANGKPELVDSEVRFNASRSGGIALYATSRMTSVGVDIEKIRPTADVEGIAARFFSPAERRALAALPAASRREAMFHCWTRKEAYVKGIATGLSVPISNIDVGVDGGRPATIADWRVQQVDVSPGFAAAVAAERYDGTAPNVQRIEGLF